MAGPVLSATLGHAAGLDPARRRRLRARSRSATRSRSRCRTTRRRRAGSATSARSPPTGQNGSTIAVDAVPTDPAATGSLDQAPVNVSITTASVSNVLVVPVDALLALANGGDAIEEIDADGVHHLVRGHARTLRRRRGTRAGEWERAQCGSVRRRTETVNGVPKTKSETSPPTGPLTRLSWFNRCPLEVEDVTRIYPGEPPLAALRGVSFRVGSGRTARHRRTIWLRQNDVAASVGHPG